MSGNSSKYSTDSSSSERNDDVRHHGNCGLYKLAKVLKNLFCCVPREPYDEIIEYDPDEYDYIIEKLVVKRVPLALFAIRADLPNLKKSDTSTSDDTSQSTSSSTVGKNETAVANIATQKPTSRIAKDKRIIDSRERFAMNVENIRNKFSNPHSDLKTSEGTSKDLSQTTSSSMRTDVSSMQAPSLTIPNEFICRGRPFFRLGNRKKAKSGRKNANLKQLTNIPSERDQHDFFPGRTRNFIVSPFRVQKGSFDLTKSKNTNGDLGVDESLVCVAKKTSMRTSNHLDASDTAVRWRITIRHQTDSEAIASKDFELSTEPSKSSGTK